jgi:GH25 family lysozyme M1 (1,4-beta-N-acetylmuramidase)
MSAIWMFEFSDISHWQGTVDFASYKSNPVLGDYVLMRSTIGAGGRDSRFHGYYDLARHNDIEVGTYFVIHPLYSPESHLGNFMDFVGNRKFKDIVADVELTGGLSASGVRARVRDTILLFENQFGDDVSIYTGAWFWNTYLKGEMSLHKFRMHFAHYVWDPNPPASLPVNYKSGYLPDGWNWSGNLPTIHQYTSKRIYPGITSSYLDQNAGNQVLKDRVFGIPDPEPEPEPEPWPIPEIGELNIMDGVFFVPFEGKKKILYHHNQVMSGGFLHDKIKIEGLDPRAVALEIRIVVYADKPDGFVFFGTNTSEGAYWVGSRTVVTTPTELIPYDGGPDLPAFHEGSGSVWLDDGHLWRHSQPYGGKLAYTLQLNAVGFPISLLLDPINQKIDILEQHIGALDEGVQANERGIKDLKSDVATRVKAGELVKISR